ncbi:MAG: hypothetical protein ACRD0O_15030 [Acidimicrobiia bacterium]
MALREEDEFLHQPPEGAPPRWQENLFFICWDLATTTGLLAHVQRVPGADFQEAQVVVAVGGRLASTSLAGPYRSGGLLPDLVATPVEPFRSWRFQCEGKGRAGAGPLGFYATRAGGDTPVSVDLMLASTLPVADFGEGLAAVVRGMRADAGGPQMGDQQHYEQGGVWRGRLRVGDHEAEAAGLFVRDHSWGVRNEHSRFEAFWTASCLDDGRLFCNAIGIPRGDRVIGVGAVVDGSGATFTTEVGAAFLPAAGPGGYDRAVVTFGAPLARTLTATTQLHIPIYLPHSGPSRYDNNAISTVGLGSARGFGVMEWASVLDDDDVRRLEAEVPSP